MTPTPPRKAEMTQWSIRAENPFQTVSEAAEYLESRGVATTKGLVVNMPARGMSFHARLFQARMWRQNAMAIKYDRPTSTGVDRRWCLEIGRYSYERCVRQSRVNAYLARRLNRRAA